MDVLSLYKQYGAFHEGRFLLASGRHSPFFLQSTTVTQHPKATDQLGIGLAGLAKQEQWAPDFVLGPAMGGVVLSFVTARELNTKSIFAEKDSKGGMKIREAFGDLTGQTFIVVEDVLTTGGSVLKAIKAAEEVGAKCLGIVCILDRRQDSNALLKNYKLVSLAQLYFETYLPEDVPAWLAERPLQEI